MHCNRECDGCDIRFRCDSLAAHEWRSEDADAAANDPQRVATAVLAAQVEGLAVDVERLSGEVETLIEEWSRLKAALARIGG